MVAQNLNSVCPTSRWEERRNKRREMRRKEMGGDRGEGKREQIGEVEKEGRKGIERIWRGEIKNLGRVKFEVTV